MQIAAPLTTARIVLRPLAAADVSQRYVQWLNDPHVNRYLESRLVVQTRETVEAFVRAMNASAHDLLLGMFTREAQRHIGNIRLGPIDEYHRRAPIGLLLGEKDAWGRGFGTEAVSAVADDAFGRLALEKLIAGCYAANLASLRLFHKAGFHEEARLRRHWRSGDEWTDGVLLVRFRPEAR